MVEVATAPSCDGSDDGFEEAAASSDDGGADTEGDPEQLDRRSSAAPVSGGGRSRGGRSCRWGPPWSSAIETSTSPSWKPVAVRSPERANTPSICRFSGSVWATNSVIAVGAGDRRQAAEEQAGETLASMVVGGDERDLGTVALGQSVVAPDGDDVGAVGDHERLAVEVVDVGEVLDLGVAEVRVDGEEPGSLRLGREGLVEAHERRAVGGIDASDDEGDRREASVVVGMSGASWIVRSRRRSRRERVCWFGWCRCPQGQRRAGWRRTRSVRAQVRPRPRVSPAWTAARPIRTTA